jgi:hypothetical protein
MLLRLYILFFMAYFRHKIFSILFLRWKYWVSTLHREWWHGDSLRSMNDDVCMKWMTVQGFTPQHEWWCVYDVNDDADIHSQHEWWCVHVVNNGPRGSLHSINDGVCINDGAGILLHSMNDNVCINDGAGIHSTAWMMVCAWCESRRRDFTPQHEWWFVHDVNDGVGIHSPAWMMVCQDVNDGAEIHSKE